MNKNPTSVCQNLFLKKLAALSSSSYSRGYLTSQKLTGFSPLKYGPKDSYIFAHDYLLHEVYRKYVGQTSVISESDRITAAIDMFRSTEAHCKMVNDRLLSSQSVRLPHGEAAIHAARLKLLRLLGSDIPIGLIASLSSFSAGSSFDLTRRMGSTPGHKFGSERPTVTAPCLKYAEALKRILRPWQDTLKSFSIVEGNRITTVEKNEEINRPIAIEPTLNMFFQKGVGTFLRRSLLKVGINLNDQTINQNLARMGSIDGSLSTIDLESASDNISLAIVELLLPPQWYQLILDLRSPVGILPNGEKIKYEKVSSMGNGFTFELESLIFWALTSSVTDFVSVYGDDIICPTKDFDKVVDVLTYSGFKVNHTKTFSVGYFRESCGGHYFNGHDVTPFYHRTDGSNRLEQTAKLILLANNLRRWIGRQYSPRYFKLYRWVVRHLPCEWQQPRICEGVGDGALIGTLAECNPYYANGTFRAKVLINKPIRLHPNDAGAFTETMFRLSKSKAQLDLLMSEKSYDRVSTSKLKLGFVRFEQWSDPVR